jgi:hypothetical protein
MAIYRPPKPRWRAAAGAGVAGLAAGVLVGAVIGRSEPDPVQAMRSVQSILDRAASSLEIVAVEYEESVDSGRVVEEAEYRGSREALASSRRRFEEVRRAVALLAPERAASIAREYDLLQEALDSRSDAEEVASQIESLDALLRGGAE